MHLKSFFLHSLFIASIIILAASCTTNQAPAETPIVISLHIPLITIEAQLIGGATTPNGRNEVVVNSKEVLDLFKDHNLKLVLQGHLHYYESMYAFGTSYVTGGSVAASWWDGRGVPAAEGG